MVDRGPWRANNWAMTLKLQEYLRPDVIQSVKRLDLKARFIVEGFISGLHSSPFHGFSVEFSEHRKYVPGDDVRAIDWGVYGKTDRFYIRKYEAQTNLDCYMLVDCSASMGYSEGGRMSKMDYAICLAAALGHLMISQQDSVGLFAFNEKICEAVAPKSTRSHLTHVLSALARICPSGQTNLAASLHEVASRIKKRGLMILLSDMLADQEEVIESLRHLRYRGHDLIVLQVLDRSEVEFEFDGSVRFEDPETGETIQADTRAIRAGYIQQMQEFIAKYRRCCQAVKADFITVDNSMTFDKALMQFLIQRSRRC